MKLLLSGLLFFNLLLLVINDTSAIEFLTLDSGPLNSVNFLPVVFSLLIIVILLSLLAYQNHQLRDKKAGLQDVLASQEAILSAIPELMFELDQQGQYINVWARNPAELTLGKSLLIGRTVTDVMPSEAANTVLQAIQEAKTNGKSAGHQIYLSTAEGDKWFELSTSIKESETQPDSFIMLSRDITPQKESARQLKVSQSRYRGLFENMADGVAIYRVLNDGDEFEIIDFNQAAERIEGMKCEEIIGKKVTEVFPDIREMGLFEVFQRVYRTGKAEAFAVSQYMDNRLSRWRDNFIYRFDSGEIVAIYSDVTARKLAEQKLMESENQKKLILQTVPDLIWLKDNNGKYQACNPVFEQFVGFPETEIIDKSDYELWEQDLADLFSEHDKIVMQADRALKNEEWTIHAGDGHKALLEIIKIPLKSDQNNIIGVLGVGHEITARHQAEEAKRLAASVFAHSSEGIIITDVDNCIIDVNPACFRLTGYTRQELIGKNPNILTSGNVSAEFYKDMWQALERQGHWQGEIQNRKKSGEVYTERLSIDVVKDNKGQLQHYVGVFSDISYLKQQELELEHIAYSDALTGLPNRLLLQDRMQQAIHQAKRHKKMVAICYLDLDGFKAVNDQHGHKAGDEVLIEVASRLQKVLRHEDSVARLGGDEFVLLMLNLHSVFELEQLLERVLKIVAKSYTLNSAQLVSVSASIGIALYPLDDSEPDTLLRHADQAMYSAKNRGKNQYSFFDPSEEQRAVETQILHSEIEQAIKNNEFKLYYQPKVNMRSGDIVGVEALIRWLHPGRGLLDPVQFLPVIEHSKLIVDLGKWVLTQVLTQISAWSKTGLTINVSVNIAPLHLQQPDFASSLKKLLHKFPGISSSQLQLEILEAAVLQDITRVSETMLQCEEMGIQFALDDFGTGYSSLTYLKQLPVRVLKIDKSFVQGLLDNPGNVALTKGIMGLSHAFNCTVVAEGVESVRHGSLLLSMGCETGQGYGIAAPMPAADLPEWMKQYEVAAEWKQVPRQEASEIDVSLLIMAVEHHRLVSQVLNAIQHKASSLLPEHTVDKGNCKFGLWLKGEGTQVYGKHSEFQRLLKKHQRVHELSQLATTQLTNGEYNQLDLIAIELRQLRNVVLDSLNNLRKR